MHFHIISIFPESLNSYLNESILARAQKSKKIKISFYNPRDFSTDRHQKTDGRPYGGGPGMVMFAEPIIKAVKKALGRKKQARIIIFSPAGKQFTNQIAQTWAKKDKDIILICGRYEGIDARVMKILSTLVGPASATTFARGYGESKKATTGKEKKVAEISVGPFVLTGGELPAMIVIDAVARQIAGVLGNELSPEENRISSSEVYTRPEVLEFKGKKYKVPKVLLSGNHAEIEKWKAKTSA
jgi:tRNA (guanine37-N1)-methyltransferase